jgi:hypothetical protein
VPEVEDPDAVALKLRVMLRVHAINADSGGIIGYWLILTSESVNYHNTQRWCIYCDLKGWWNSFKVGA